jgi:hypothetical protein
MAQQNDFSNRAINGRDGKGAMPSFLAEIASAFGVIPGVEAVAWCGSTAMGTSDNFSDFDLYVYTDAPVSVQAREAAIAGRATGYQLNNTFWELEGLDCELYGHSIRGKSSLSSRRKTASDLHG